MFEYQASNRFFAQIMGGIEDLVIAEFSELGAKNITPSYRGLYFVADQSTLYKINYMSRFATRVLAPLTSFMCHNTEYLYRKASTIDWSELLDVDSTFAIFANVSNSKIRHSQYVALCLKDAIVDDFRKKFNKRPNIDTTNPDIWLNLFIENNRATINFDTSCGSLHRRGYRKVAVDAPMQETLAASIIKFTGWNGCKPIYDIMCGSGTFISEALLYYCKIPSGIFRKRFGFELMPDFDKELWVAVKKEAETRICELPEGLIFGSDISERAIEFAEANIHNLPYSDRIKLRVTDFRDIESLENVVIVCNPPYGIRTGKKEEVEGLYKELGDFLKRRCKGSEAYIYFGNRELIPKIGLHPGWKKQLFNGPLDGRLCKFDIY